MAAREALREFQARLADRLQTARTAGVSASWLAVEAGEAGYLLPLGQAGEIFPWTLPQAVPYTLPWFLGVANLRGGLYGVVQLSAFAGGQAAVPVADVARAQSRLVALNEALEVNCALLVDRLAGLRGVEAFAACEPPPEGSPGWQGEVYIDGAGRRWREIQLAALAQLPEFLSIGA
ncbi:MAG: chemotaxis protein CheW [Xenophilus sp.]